MAALVGVEDLGLPVLGERFLQCLQTERRVHASMRFISRWSASDTPRAR